MSPATSEIFIGQSLAAAEPAYAVSAPFSDGGCWAWDVVYRPCAFRVDFGPHVSRRWAERAEPVTVRYRHNPFAESGIDFLGWGNEPAPPSDRRGMYGWHAADGSTKFIPAPDMGAAFRDWHTAEADTHAVDVFAAVFCRIPALNPPPGCPSEPDGWDRIRGLPSDLPHSNEPCGPHAHPLGTLWPPRP